MVKCSPVAKNMLHSVQYDRFILLLLYFLFSSVHCQFTWVGLFAYTPSNCLCFWDESFKHNHVLQQPILGFFGFLVALKMLNISLTLTHTRTQTKSFD